MPSAVSCGSRCTRRSALESWEQIWQVQAALGYRFSESLSLTAGYRYLHYDYINDDYAWDVETRGAYLGLGFIW